MLLQLSYIKYYFFKKTCLHAPTYGQPPRRSIEAVEPSDNQK